MLSQLIASGLVMGGAYVLVALGLDLVFGILDVVNFAHGLFYTIGAYVAFSLTVDMGIGFLQSLLLSLIVIAIFSFIIEKLVFKKLRNKGHLPQILVSYGIAILLGDGIRLIWSAEPQQLPAPYANKVMHIGGVILNYQRLLVLFISIIIVGLLILLIKYTWLGLQMRAVSQDSIAARLNGMNMDLIASFVFIIAGVITATAGILIGPIFVVTPLMGDEITNKAFAVIILGGIGNIKGAIIAGLILGIAESIISGYISTGLENAIAFGIVIFTLLFKPRGLFNR